MTEKNEIVLMNFTGVYKEQEFYREEKISWVDVQGLSGCSCYCDGEAQEILEKKIADLPVKGIHFVDSGNYHYMSLLWLKKYTRHFACLYLTITRTCSRLHSEGFCPAEDGRQRL